MTRQPSARVLPVQQKKPKRKRVSGWLGANASGKHKRSKVLEIQEHGGQNTLFRVAKAHGA
jgi:hypothetical protein